MPSNRREFCGLLLAGAGGVLAGPHRAAAAEPDPLAPWRSGVRVRPATGEEERHTVHSYFNTCPESPDGRWVLYFASTDPEGHLGSVCVRERATGKERVLARHVSTEDAHRVACQQWVSGGRRVVYHAVRDGQWRVAAVDLDTGKERVLVRDRQLCWGQPDGDVVPVYGCHWNPGEHRDLELVNVATGAIRKTATAAGVREAFSEGVSAQFGDKPISIFFPELSPNGKRVFFKLATPSGGDFRSKAASARECLVVYDIEQGRYLLFSRKWGHPEWLPDSRTILNAGPTLLDTDTNTLSRIPGLPPFPGSHPSMSRDGRLFATDLVTAQMGGPVGEWAVAVGDVRGERSELLYRFDNSRGARSWRRSHPHPVFSRDGKRLYFNVSRDNWTRLYVAEAGTSAA